MRSCRSPTSATETVSRVVDKFILQLELQLAEQNVHIQFDSDARAWLAERGYDKLYGARPMARLIQEKVKQPLAEELLFGKLAHGGEVHVSVKDDALSFELTPAPPKVAGQGRRRPAKAKPADEEPTAASERRRDRGTSTLAARLCSEDGVELRTRFRPFSCR